MSQSVATTAITQLNTRSSQGRIKLFGAPRQ